MPEIGGVSQLDTEAFGADLGFEFPRGAPCHHHAVVEYGDLVGERVCLLEVLGGEQDRGPLARKSSDDLPQGPAATWIEPGGGLVEKTTGGAASRLAARSSRRRMPPE
jgi:hypothetical protein